MRHATRHARMFAAAGLSLALWLCAASSARAGGVAIATPTGPGPGRITARRLVRALRARGLRVVVPGARRPVSGVRTARRLAAEGGYDAVIATAVRRRGKRALLTVRVFGPDGRLWIVRRYRLRRPRLPRRAARRLALYIQRRMGKSRPRPAAGPSTAGHRRTVDQKPQSPPVSGEPSPGTGMTSVTDKAPRAPAGHAERTGRALSLSVHLDTVSSTNLFLDRSAAWDLVLRPRFATEVDVSRVMSVGYQGELNSYLEHDDLLSHWHQVRLLANPAWGAAGKPGSRELLVRVGVETLRNQPAYEVINHVRTSVDVHWQHTLARWLRWTAAAGVGYRLFYRDRPSDTLGAWVSTKCAFLLPTRTTVIPRVRYGLRAYPNPVSTRTDDFHDQQVELGVHLSQALWKRAGLQLDYAYLRALGPSSLMERNLTRQQFNYLGLDFCCSGHRAGLVFKQILGSGASLGLSVHYQQRLYNGWPAVDEDLQPTGGDRHDHRLIPGAYVAISWRARESAAGLGVRAGYQFVRQWSSSDWYDTSAHMGQVALHGSW